MKFDTELLAITSCIKCDISNGRTNIVNGVGRKDADLMIIGEAPGYYEDINGTPFVGNSGELLNIMLRLIGIEREECYITNVIKCRPTNNRKPIMREINNCKPCLISELLLVDSKIIVLLGTTALQTYYKNYNLRITDYHGKILTETVRSSKKYIIPIYHPSYILYNMTKPLIKDYMKQFKKVGLLYKHFVNPLIDIQI